MPSITYSDMHNCHAGTPLFRSVCGAIVGDMKGIEELRALPVSPNGSGVYFLWLKDVLMYVGCSASIQTRLYHHHCAFRYKTAGYRVWVPHDRGTGLLCDREDMRALEKEYIRAYCPPFNKQSNPRCS